MPNGSAGTTFRRQTMFVPGALFGRGGGGKRVQHTAVSRDLEKPDVQVITGKVIVHSSLSRTSAGDTVAATAKSIATATFANTEAADSISAAGKTYWALKLNVTTSDGISATGAIPNHGRCSVTEAGDGITAQAQAVVKAALAATESGDGAVGKIGGPVARIVEASDGVNATGTASAFSWGITHYNPP